MVRDRIDVHVETFGDIGHACLSILVHEAENSYPRLVPSEGKEPSPFRDDGIDRNLPIVTRFHMILDIF